MRQSVQLAECVGDATPLGLRFGRPALHVAHHDQTIDEVPAVRGRNRHRHRHPSTIEVSQQLRFPRQVGVAAPIAAPAEPTDGELPVDAHAPHLVDASGSERFDPSDVVAPSIECLPSHGHIIAEGREALEGCSTRGNSAPDVVGDEPEEPDELIPRHSGIDRRMVTVHVRPIVV